MALTKQQLEERKRYIGGSDAAGVLGLSRWQTPLSVWAIKTGQVEPEDIGDKICVKLGNKLEQAVAELFMEHTGKKVHRVNETLYHPKHKFIAANLDRRVVGENAVLECKTANQFKAKDWEGEDIPIEYIIQCIHQLAVTGADRAYIAVIIGNVDFKYKVIERDEKVIADLIEKEVNFWNNFVAPKVMPATIKAGDDDILYQLYPVAEPESCIELGDKANAVIESLDSLKADKKVVEKQIAEAENTLKAMLQDNEAGITDKFKITWKNQERRGIDTKRLKLEKPDIAKEYEKVSGYRMLRVGKIKRGNE